MEASIVDILECEELAIMAAVVVIWIEEALIAVEC